MVCYNKSKKWYCAHCIKTSPNLLLKWRLNLLLIKHEKIQFEQRVNDILKNALDDNNDTANDQKDNDTERNIYLLNERMKKLKLLKSKKQIVETKEKINNLRRIINRKKNIVQKLMIEVKEKPNIPRIRINDNGETYLHYPKSSVNKRNSMSSINSKNGNRNIIYMNENERIELVNKKDQINNIVDKFKREKINNLNSWFLIERLTIPRQLSSYTIQFQPIFSLRKFKNMERHQIINCTISLCHYLTLYANMTFFQLPYPLQKAWQSHSIHFITDRHLTYWLGWLVMNIVALLKYNNLLKLSSNQSIDLSWLLDHYDIDGLFYHLTQGTQIEQKHEENSTPDRYSYHIAFSIIAEALQLPVQDTRITNNHNNNYGDAGTAHTQRGDQLSNVQPDRWFVVG